MYSKQKSESWDLDDKDYDAWNIYDPDGDVIARVLSEEEADVLLSHLNR